MDGMFTITETMNQVADQEDCSPATLSDGNGLQMGVSGAGATLQVTLEGAACTSHASGCRVEATCTSSDGISDVTQQISIDFSSDKLSGIDDLTEANKMLKRTCSYHFPLKVERR